MASKNKSKPTKSINQFDNIYENISIISYQANCENSYTATNGIKMVMWMVYDIKKIPIQIILWAYVWGIYEWKKKVSN